MRYTHQMMKRSGGTTILKQMLFERAIFQFTKTPNGRIEVISKEAMKQNYLKGMSPDLTDNIIMACGGLVYDTYKLLSEDSGISRKKIAEEDPERAKKEARESLIATGVIDEDGSLKPPFNSENKVVTPYVKKKK